MGVVTDLINRTASIEEGILENIVIGYIDVNAPFFATPIMRTITKTVVDFVVKVLSEKLALGTVQLVTVIKTTGEESDLSKAMAANIDAQKGSDEVAKALARQKLLDAARAFGQLYTP